MFGDFLYSLSSRDSKITPLDILVDYVSVGGLNVVADAVYTVPTDRVLILRSFTARATPGAAQNLLIGEVGITRVPFVAGQPLQSWLQYFVSAGAGVVSNASRILDILVPPSASIVFKTVYNANANPNTTELSLQGYLIPRGNFAV